MTPPKKAGRIEAHAPIKHQEASHVGWAGFFAHRFTPSERLTSRKIT